MKKLNKSELEALTRRVRNEVQDLIDIEQKRLDEENEAFYAVESARILAELNGLGDTTQGFIRENSSYSTEDIFSEERVREHLRKIQTKHKPVSRHWGTSVVMDELVLAQLESDSVSDLVASVVASLTAKGG